MPRRKNGPVNPAGFADGLNGVSNGGKSQKSGEAGDGSLRNTSAACQTLREKPEFAAAVAKIAASEIAADHGADEAVVISTIEHFGRALPKNAVKAFRDAAPSFPSVHLTMCTEDY